MANNVHMLLSIPPKYGVSQVVGYNKGKSAIRNYIRNQEKEGVRLEQLVLWR